MSLVDLGVVYALAGVACAVAVYRATPGPRAAALAHAAIAVAIWPIWGPLTLTSRATKPAPKAARRAARVEPPPNPVVARAEAALRDAAAACAGTPLEGLLSAEAADRLAGEMRRAAARHADVLVALTDPTFDLGAAEAKVAALEAATASPRALATARLHRDNVRRLVALRDRDARALAELEELVMALKTQLWLARVAGAPDGGASDLVAELRARVEGLDAATHDSDAGGEPAPGGVA